MLEGSEALQLGGDTLEIHYWFTDDSHSMNANVANKCEYELLAVIKEVAQQLSLEITIDTLPVGEGGLRRWLRVISKDENKKSTISSALLIAILIALLAQPLGKVGEKLVEKIFEDKELNDLQKEKLKLEIEKLKQDIDKGANIDNNILIKKRKSNFYDTLEKYPKVAKVSYSISEDAKDKKNHERIIERAEFKKFILASDELEPLQKDDAVIEIISPVLKTENYKWMGYYNGEPISFNMKSKEFRTLVQNGSLEFKNGSSINCSLRIQRRIDSEGIVKNTGYDVIRVNHYFQNDKPIETREGKQHRQKKEAQKNQLKLFNSGEKDN